MDDLINFDNCIQKRAVSPKLDVPVLEPVKLSTCIVKPIPPIEYNVYDDPYDPFEPQGNGNDTPASIPELTDGSLFSFDCFSNASHDLPTSQETTISEAASHKTVASRSLSDSSTISSKSIHPATKINRSVDDMRKRQQQLLKLSFYNSPNSPLNSTSFLNSTVADNVLKEAKNIAKKFGDFSELSFEDLNNISQHLIDASGDLSAIDLDFQDMKINIPNEKHEQHITSSPDKIKLNEQLMRIKKEVDAEESEKTEIIEGNNESAKTEESDVEDLWQKLKSVINEGNKDEAKKQLLRLNEALGRKPQQAEPKSTMEVQPIVRQATFEIDPQTGERKDVAVKEPAPSLVTDDLLRQLAALLTGQAAGVHAIDLKAQDTAVAKLAVVIVPTPASTPIKNPRPAVSRTQSAIKPPSEKKQATPLKRLTQTSRRTSFTNPRPVVPSRVQPYEQRTMHAAAGAVRKSLMGSIDKSPNLQKTKSVQVYGTGIKPAPRPSTYAAPRRSVSLKIPDVHLTKPSPMKNTAIRPSTGAPYNKRLSQLAATPDRAPATSRVAPIGRRSTLFDQKKPISDFRVPSAVRKAAASSLNKESLV